MRTDFGNFEYFFFLSPSNISILIIVDRFMLSQWKKNCSIEKSDNEWLSDMVVVAVMSSRAWSTLPKWHSTWIQTRLSARNKCHSSCCINLKKLFKTNVLLYCQIGCENAARIATLTKSVTLKVSFFSGKMSWLYPVLIILCFHLPQVHNKDAFAISKSGKKRWILLSVKLKCVYMSVYDTMRYDTMAHCS